MAGFNPDAYLASKTAAPTSAPTPFDPDTYLKSKENPPIPKGQERTLGGLMSKQTAQNWVNALPTATAIAGGLAGTPLGPAGAIGGAGLGGYGGRYLKGAIETSLDLPDAPKNATDAHVAPLKGGLIDATGEGVGLSIANAIKGNPLKISASALEKVKALAQGGQEAADAIPKKEIPGLFEISNDMFNNIPKPNSSEIEAAAGRLGTKATPGMLTNNKNLQNIEQVLSERPTIAGELVRGRYSPLRESLGETAEQVGQRTAASPYESGAEAQKQLISRIGERLDPLKASYDEIAQSTSKASIDPKMAERAAQGLLKTPIASTAGTETNAVANKFGDMFTKAKSAQDLQNIVSEAKDLARSSDGKIRLTATKAAQSGERLLRRGLLNAGEGSPESIDEAKGLITQLRTTNKGYRSLATDIDDAIGQLKLGTSSPGDVVRKLDEMPSEQVAERLFNTKNVDALNNLKKFSPEGFESVRQNRLNQIVDKSMTKGQIDPAKLVRNFKGLPPEVKTLLVGDQNVSKLADAETLINALPDIVGPSRTPRGLSWHNFNPFQVGTELSDLVKLRALSTGQMPTPVKALQKGAGMLQSPGLPPAILTGSGLIRSREKRPGQ